MPGDDTEDVSVARRAGTGDARGSTADDSVAPVIGPDDPRRFTDSGIEVRPLYTSADLPEDLDALLGEPGAFPFTRGPHREMYRRQLWTMRQYAGYASAKESNARYKYLLAHGSTGLSMAFDLPTQLGRTPTTRAATRSTTCARPSTGSRSARSRRR
jgi:methylmalonyl-CoA mutase N-terminal domain/subunit